MKFTIQPSLDEFKATYCNTDNAGPDSNYNMVPVFATISADFITPCSAYLKLSKGHKYSFLLESSASGNTVGRYSFIGVHPHKTLITGPEFEECDPLLALEAEVNKYRPAPVPELPPLSGGAVGYIGYDCTAYFEPKTRRPLKDRLQLPESMLFFYDTIVCFDHLFQLIKIIYNIPYEGDVESGYSKAVSTIQSIIEQLLESSTPLPPQPPIIANQTSTSNIGQSGYEQHVKRLKEHIYHGDIIQAVPSQRIARPTCLHPFNAYRQLCSVNPSPYMFYIDCGNFQVVGASPELLVKTENGRIITHPIAGTTKRGDSFAADEKNAQELTESIKDRAEHIMLVDLARNDINRVCDPQTTRVDRLMGIERFSHVMHLVSQVSGVLRPDKTIFDAFRSIFPAGTVSGAPKVRAMELIAELEGERRGVYAGAIGHWGYGGQNMDTCIALRTMVFKDGVAYLQAGGGIVFDSDPYDEYMETMNKLASNIACIEKAEAFYG